MVPVDIIDDSILEDLIENFTARLTSDVLRLVLTPDEATVNNIDNENDSKLLIMSISTST